MFFVSVSKLCFGCWTSKIRLTKEKAKKSESVRWKYEMHEQMVRAELSTSEKINTKLTIFHREAYTISSEVDEN